MIRSMYRLCMRGMVYSPPSAAPYMITRHSSSLKQLSNDLFNIPKLMHPDIYNASEAKAWAQHKSMDKTLSQYYRPRPYKPWSHAWNRKVEGISWNWWDNDYEGWEECEWRSRFMWNRMEASRICFFSLQRFTQKALKLEAISMYKSISEAIANPQELRDVKALLSPTLYGQLEGQSKRFASSNQIEWKMVKEPSLSDVKLVDGKVGRPSSSPNSQLQSKLGFAQWTLEIKSEQTFAVYSKKGASNKGLVLTSGDPDKVIQVVDYWVFERPIFIGWVPREGPRGARWTLVDRLNVPNGRSPPPPSKG